MCFLPKRYLNSFPAGSRTEAVGVEDVGEERLDEGSGQGQPTTSGFDVVAENRFKPVLNNFFKTILLLIGIVKNSRTTSRGSF